MAWANPAWDKAIVGEHSVATESIDPNPWVQPPITIGVEKLRIDDVEWTVTRQEYPMCCGVIMYTGWGGGPADTNGRALKKTWIPILQHWIKWVSSKSFNWNHIRAAITAVPDYGKGVYPLYDVVMDTGQIIARFKNPIHSESIISLVLFRPDKLGVSKYDLEAPDRR